MDLQKDFLKPGPGLNNSSAPGRIHGIQIAKFQQNIHVGSMYFVGLDLLIICIDPVLSNITSTKSDHYVYCKDNSNSRFGNISKYPTSSFLGSVERGRDLSLFLMTRDIETW